MARDLVRKSWVDKLKAWLMVTVLAVSGVVAPIMSTRVSAEGWILTPEQMDTFSQGGIYFYVPDNDEKDDDCVDTVHYSGNEVTWEDLAPLTGNDRLRLLVETYGEYAMDLQRYYGLPWELPFAIMVFESQVGADHSEASVSYQIEQAGYFNLMGLTDGFGVDHYKDASYPGYYVQSTGLTFAGYDTISEMLLGYAIYHGRNGLTYDDGLKMLSPDSYRLEAALTPLMESYCPGGCYTSSIMSLIRTGSSEWSAILDVTREKGWKNSEELAKAENIQAGGIATEKWGWGDIREQIWEAYGKNGLPTSVAAGLGAATTTSASGQVTAATGGGVTLHSPTHDWLDSAGLTGYIKNEINTMGANGYPIDDFVVDASGNYLPYASDAGNGSGLPGFIVLHLTSADNFGARNWTNYCGTPEQPFYCPPHFTIDVKNREVFQHFPLSHPSAAVRQKPDGMLADQYGVQIEIVGHGGTPGVTCMEGACSDEYLYTNFTDDDWQYIAELLIAISNETGIPLTSSVTWANDANEAYGLEMSSSDLKAYTGVLGHTHINGKWDPLNVWKYLEPKLEEMGYSYSGDTVNLCYDKSSSSSNNKGTCFELDPADGGCTADGFTYYWQGGPSWGGTALGYGDTIATGGCGYSATAMVVTALTGKQVTPLDAYNVAKSVDGGAFYTSAGTLAEVVPGIINNGGYGLSLDSYGDNSGFTEANISNLLEQGKMIIMSVGSETGDTTFTGGAHWIAIRGITENGKWKVFSSSPRPSGEVNDMEFEPSQVVSVHVNHRNYWFAVSK